MERDEIKRVIESFLFVSDKPISIDTMHGVLKDVDAADIRTSIEELNAEYASSGRSFSIKEIAGGFQMLTDPAYSRWISLLHKRGPDRLTGPSLETLAIIAYKQPIPRSDIEVIRGVNVDGVLRTLEDRKLIRTKGRLDAPGRPILYATTPEFLQHFGLRSLEELPKLKEFQESDLDFVKEKEKAQLLDVASPLQGPDSTVAASDRDAGSLERGTDWNKVSADRDDSRPDTREETDVRADIGAGQAERVIIEEEGSDEPEEPA